MLAKKDHGMAKQRKRKARPVCAEHWQKMRKEAFAVLPFWSRPLAGKKINQLLRDKGFVKSDEECAYCRSSNKAEPEH
jgi:hypothetical protein